MPFENDAGDVVGNREIHHQLNNPDFDTIEVETDQEDHFTRVVIEFEGEQTEWTRVDDADTGAAEPQASA